MIYFEDIFNDFKDKITSYDIALLDEDEQEDTMFSLLDKACRRFNRICHQDLAFNPNLNGFVQELSDEEIDIITEWMVVYWIKPIMNNEDNMKNILNTKDYSMYSPANLLSNLKDLYESSRKRARSLMNEYSFAYSDIETWKT